MCLISSWAFPIASNDTNIKSVYCAKSGFVSKYQPFVAIFVYKPASCDALQIWAKSSLNKGSPPHKMLSIYPILPASVNNLTISSVGISSVPFLDFQKQKSQSQLHLLVTINEKHNGFGVFDNLLAIHSKAPPPK